MKIKALCAALAMIATAPAWAVFNLYSKDGLTLDVQGEVNLYAKKQSKDFNIDYTGELLPAYQDPTSGAWSALQDTYERQSDKRVRLAQDPGASWLEVRGSQHLNNDWRATATLGLGYWDNATGGFLNTANLSFDKRNLGAVSIGRQYLHTAYVTRTATYTPLETFATQSIRADYTGIKGLHVSGYYNTPVSKDVRYVSDDEVKGYGASASYLYPLADKQSLRVAAGYAKSYANPAKGDGTNLLRNADEIAIDGTGLATSLEYRVGNLLLAADVGQRQEKLDGNVIRGAKSTYTGLKVGYQVTPKFNVVAGYGTQNTKRTRQDGAVVLAGLSQDCPEGCAQLVDAYSSFLFDESKRTKTYVRADYYLRDNVRAYVRADQEKIQNTLDGTSFSNSDNKAYYAGISLSF